MEIDISLIQKLRAATGTGVMDAKRVLLAANGNYDKAVELLRQQGQKLAAKKQDRATREGVVGSYVHANGKVAALVALACESDFVARTPDFQELAHDIAMHVAAAAPVYLAPAEVPADLVSQETAIYREQLKNEKKPEKMWDKIIAGKLDKYFQEICLLKQPFIKEDKKTIEQLIQEKILKLGENIQVKEFKRMML